MVQIQGSNSFYSRLRDRGRPLRDVTLPGNECLVALDFDWLRNPDLDLVARTGGDRFLTVFNIIVTIDQVEG